MLPETTNEHSSHPSSPELGTALEGFESQQNLTGVFSLLLAIDKRMKPQTYSVQPSVNEYA